MMKRFILSLYVLLFVVVFFGCTLNRNGINKNEIKSDYDKKEEKTYQVLIYDYSNSIPSARHEIEYEFADHKKYDEQIIKPEVVMSVKGESFSGTYQLTQYRGYNYYPLYRYLDSNGNFFEIDDTGILASYFWGKSSSKEEKLTQDDCVRIAKTFVGSIVDIKRYDVSVEEDKDREGYKVTFTKYINGLKTTDSATVFVQYNGELYSYSSYMLGKVNVDAAVVDDLDINGVVDSINKKLDQIYKDTKNTYSRVDFKEFELLLTVLKDGSTGLVCSVVVNCVDVFLSFFAWSRKSRSLNQTSKLVLCEAVDVWSCSNVCNNFGTSVSFCYAFDRSVDCDTRVSSFESVDLTLCHLNNAVNFVTSFILFYKFRNPHGDIICTV